MELSDIVAAQARRKGATQVNQQLRLLQSSTDSNRMDMGRYSAGPAAFPWWDLSPAPHAHGAGEAPGKTARYPKRCCRSVAGHHPVKR